MWLPKTFPLTVFSSHLWIISAGLLCQPPLWFPPLLLHLPPDRDSPLFASSLVCVPGMTSQSQRSHAMVTSSDSASSSAGHAPPSLQHFLGVAAPNHSASPLRIFLFVLLLPSTCSPSPDIPTPLAVRRFVGSGFFNVVKTSTPMRSGSIFHHRLCLGRLQCFRERNIRATPK